MSTEEFTEEQKQYLQGFAAGSGLNRIVSLPVAANPSANTAEIVLGPDSLQRQAQDRTIAAGKKLVAEETAKRNKSGLDIWDEVAAHARDAKFPKGTDVFLFKFQGLFYVSPAQDSFMSRLRFPGGIISSHQMRGVADLAEKLGGGYTDVTTRANLQIREIGPKNTIDLLIGLSDLGIINRGSGADNIRNITNNPTAGFDPQELIDTRSLARQMHHYILNHREMYGLPRKFNIAFDGGGTISALEDTNDIGFVAVKVGDGNTVSGEAIPAGVYFRMELGGITGHKDFARDTGILLKPDECIATAAAVVRAFLDHGDRTDRKKARLKYLLDAWGLEKFLAEVQKHLPAKFRFLPREKCEKNIGQIDRFAHVGFHPQKQADRVYLGVVLPVGRLTAAQMRGISRIADQYGSGDLRLTVWQNLLIPDIATSNIPWVKKEITDLGLHWDSTAFRAGLVACTGKAGCKYAASHTKAHALQIADYLEARVKLDQSLNIHLTGCHHSCAQHYIGDIGLIGTAVPQGEEAVEGYNICVGGGYGQWQNIGTEIYREIPATECGPVIHRMLEAYLGHRKDAAESFQAFIKRHSIEELKNVFNVSVISSVSLEAGDVN